MVPREAAEVVALVLEVQGVVGAEEVVVAEVAEVVAPEACSTAGRMPLPSTAA